MYKSRVNQPERVFVNSSDDSSSAATEPGFATFQATFDTPILGAKRAQLLRCTIPNAQVNVPDYMCVFYYYNLPTATTVPSAATLKAVRLYPSNYQAPAALGTAYTKNRYFSDPADFVTQLNAAAAVGGDALANNPIWANGDVTFAYNATTKQITMTGNTAGRFYAIAGWDDPVVNAYQASGAILMPNFNGVGTTAQPQVVNWTLNLRVGYAYSGTSFDRQAGGNANARQAYANVTNTAFANAVAIPSDSYPNLVYSQCVYLYANIVAGSSLGSGRQHNLLSVIPSNAPQLGVISYVATTVNWLTKVPDNIHEIFIEMRDDANQPFTLPDNAQVNVEFGFYYKDE